MKLEIDFRKPGQPSRRVDDSPLRFLILADLRGEAARTSSPEPLSKRRIARVDVDNLDRVLAGYAPAVGLADDDGASQLMQFRSIDQLHPDELVENAELFKKLRTLRQRLQDPATFAAAAAELTADRPTAAAADVPAEPQLPADSGSMFERLLGREASLDRPAGQLTQQTEHAIDRLIQGIVAPHVVAAPDPQQALLVSAVDAAMGDALRGLLHYPPFQALEATWRAIQWLVSTLELGEELQLHLLHVTRDELARGVGPGSELYQRVVDKEARTAGGLQFSLIVGNYRFGPTVDDIELLEAIGQLAADAGSTFVGEAASGLLGCEAIARQPDPSTWGELEGEIEARWQALRGSAAAASVVLALPRLLLRLPYGDKTDSIESFDFEEITLADEHGALLWGNPAFAVALATARTLLDQGAGAAEIDDLPAFVVTDAGESRLKPCAETCLSERAVDAIIRRGLTPLVSHKDRNAVRLVRVQSLAG